MYVRIYINICKQRLTNFTVDDLIDAHMIFCRGNL